MDAGDAGRRHGTMTTRELLTQALNGGTPARTPLSFGSWMTGDPYADDY